MVCGVMRHVPGKEADRRIAEGGAGVRQHVGHERAGRVLGQQIGPKEGLAQKGWKEP